MNVFDIIGPVMTGPSSSHTAGAARIGRMARMLLGREPKKAEILLHGSFARTYKGHGTDKAIVAGILGMETDDPMIRNAFSVAEERGLEVSIDTVELDGAHPNTAIIKISDGEGLEYELRGSSIGGGSILINEINSVPVNITGENTAVIIVHKDKPGIISHVTEILAEEKLNIGGFRYSRVQRGGEAIMSVELEGDLKEEVVDRMRNIENVTKIVVLRPVM